MFRNNSFPYARNHIPSKQQLFCIHGNRSLEHHTNYLMSARIINWATKRYQRNVRNMISSDLLSEQPIIMSEHRIIPFYLYRILSHLSDITYLYIISYHIISYHIISYHIISYHIISYHIISNQIKSHHITSHHITTQHNTTHHITSHHITSHYSTSRHVMCHVSYHTMHLTAPNHTISHSPHRIRFSHSWFFVQTCHDIRIRKSRP